MLKNLLISNYALIQHLEVQINTGFTTITGETGAGKSILLGAIGLIMGKRADTTVISTGEKKCIIEATFEIQNHLKSLFEVNDIDFENQSILRREVQANGKSRAFVNDTPVTLSILREISHHLIEIQTQHTGLLMSESGQQLKLLDALVENSIIENYTSSYVKYRLLEKEFLSLKEQQEETLSRKDYLEFLTNEIHEISTEVDEDIKIEQEIKKLTQSEEIQRVFNSLSDAISEGEQNLTSSLRSLISLLKPLQNFDRQYQELYKRLESVQIELDDIGNEALSISENTEQNPDRLNELNDRFDLIQQLIRKHRVQDVKGLLEVQEKMQSELRQLDSNSNRLEEVREEMNVMLDRCKKHGVQLSQSRKQAAEVITNEALDTLIELGMADAQIKYEVTYNVEQLSSSGSDLIKLYFSANKGVPLEVASNIASGGELSRLSFAFRSSVSQRKKLPTLIYDEADTGISGEIAGKMAAQFRKLGQQHQVIAISHLPQVAAAGDHQWEVYKSNHSGKTETRVKTLSTEERIQAIASMLSGDSITQAAVENAKQLLNI